MRSWLAPDAAFVEAVLRRGGLPDALTGAGLRWARSEEGLRLMPSRSVDERRLLELGLRPGPALVESESKEASCWAELVPCEPGPPPELPVPQALFRVSQDGLTTFVKRLLHLGCTDQSLLVLSDGTALVRAVEPPYFSLISEAQVYLPAAPFVWVQWGLRHPLAEVLRPSAGASVLIADAGWLHVPDGPFQELAASLELAPVAKVSIAARPPPRIEVRLQLEPSSAPAPDALWVLRQDGASTVERLAAELPSAALEDLEFFVAEDGLVMVRGSRRAPAQPALELPGAEVYAAHPRLERLFLPVGTEVAPPLRLTQLRDALAPDPEQLSLLVPQSEARPTPFRVQTVADDAFRPLSEWVDYVAAGEPEAMEGWKRSLQFEFQPFVRAQTWAEAEEAQPSSRRSWRRQAEARPEPEPDPEPEAAPARAALPSPPRGPALEAVLTELTPASVRAVEQRLLEGETSHPAEDWFSLVGAYLDAGRESEAGLALGHGLLATPRADRSERARAWVERAELAPLGADPEPVRLRWAVFELLAGREDDLPLLRTRTEGLDTRSFWLLWDAVARREDDALARARAVDDVVERLRGSLAPRDVPAFVRTEGGGQGLAADALAAALAEARETHFATRRQRSPLEAPEGLTQGYVELGFAWGFGRLGALGEARAALRSSEARFGTAAEGPVHAFARAALLERIAAAQAGAGAGRLSEPLERAYAELARMERYVVDRLAEASVAIGLRSEADAFARFGSKGLEWPEDLRPASLLSVLDACLDDAFPEPEEVLEALHLARLLPPHHLADRLDGLGRACGALEGPAKARGLASVLRLADAVDAPVANLVRDLAELLGADEPSGAKVVFELAPLLERRGAAAEVRAALKEGLHREALPLEHRLVMASAAGALGETEASHRWASDALGLAAATGTPMATRLQLARVLLRGLGRSSPELAVAAVRRLQAELLPQVTDSGSTNTHFCRALIHFAESVVVGLATPDGLLGPRARRFLDAEEHTLRQAILAEAD